MKDISERATEQAIEDKAAAEELVITQTALTSSLEGERDDLSSEFRTLAM